MSSQSLLLKVFAHELGHSLGMPHDFLKSDNDPRLDESGNSCLGTNGIMSYKVRYLIRHQLCNEFLHY